VSQHDFFFISGSSNIHLRTGERFQFKIKNRRQARGRTRNKGERIKEKKKQRLRQSSVIFSCSSGIGTKFSRTICRERSSGSQCAGTSFRIKSGRTESSARSVRQYGDGKARAANLPSRVKSKRGGKSFPFGILAPSTRSSSKKACTIASMALSRAPGVYSSNFATKSIASGAVRGRKTCVIGMSIQR
jgi:transposase